MIKMKGEIPVFRRCCICVPLRYGLLAWGYFKMIADVLILFLLSYSFTRALIMIRTFEAGNLASWMITDMIIITISITVFFADLIVTIVFIIGGHKKNVKLMRVFYFVSMGLWVFTLLLSVTSIIRTIVTLVKYYASYWGIYMLLLSSCFYFVILVVQSYFLLLLRSEIIKLRNSSEFRFVNNAAAAECTITCEEKIAGAEIVKDGITN